MLYIIRGLPGSGKSTLAKKLAEALNCKHFEADMYFMTESGEYKFDAKELHLAHYWCYRSVVDELDRGNNVIVSNTFTTIREMEDYIMSANNLNIPTRVIQCTGEYGSVHNVPEETLAKMKARFMDNDVIQQRWGTDHLVSYQKKGYVDPLPDYGDVFPLDEFVEMVESGFFIDYDGHGYPVKNNLVNNDIIVKPSKIDEIPKDATHIIWFNR